MTNAIKIKGGLEADRLSQTPESRELLVTTDELKLYLGDGATVGGKEITTTSSTTSSTNGTSIDFFQVQDNSASSQALTTSFADVTGIWGAAFTGSGYTWDGTELTVTSASDAIEFNASAQGIVTGNNRVEVGLRLMADTGSGYVELTRVSQYALRNNANDEGNVTFGGFHVFNVVAGTKFKIQVSRVGSASSIGSQGGTYFNAKRYSVSTASGIQIEVVTEYPATPNAETLYLKVEA